MGKPISRQQIKSVKSHFMHLPSKREDSLAQWHELTAVSRPNNCQLTASKTQPYIATERLAFMIQAFSFASQKP
jgi:hypothetical protein